MTELVLFTQSYPYGAAMEDTFMAPELPALRAAFDRVVIVPSQRAGTRATLPDGVELDDSLAELLHAQAGRVELARLAATTKLTRDELRARPGLIASPRALAALAVWAARAELARRWARDLFTSGRADATRAVAYTFWCEHVTTGLALLKRELPQLVVASRAHGIDLYPERHDPPYLPCREFTLRQLDGLFPDSERGARYVTEHYAWFAARCMPALMGVGDPGFVAGSSTPDTWSILSCSRLVPVKRVDLIARGIAEAARRRPAIKFTWRHFGEGSLRGAVEDIVRRELGSNVRAELPGFPSLDELMTCYRTQPIDVFLNASSSEGTPVSVMEAISCGVPVIATAVGGLPEIVTADNGTLVGATPTPDELADAIVAMVDDREASARKRLASRAMWESKYDAARNYAAFAQRLLELRAQR